MNFTAKGFRVIGFDIDEDKIRHLLQGKSYIEHISSAPISAAVAANLLEATTDFSRVSEPDALVICVPARWAQLIVDTRNSMAKVTTRAGLVVKA